MAAGRQHHRYQNVARLRDILVVWQKKEEEGVTPRDRSTEEMGEECDVENDM